MVLNLATRSLFITYCYSEELQGGVTGNIILSRLPSHNTEHQVSLCCRSVVWNAFGLLEIIFGFFRSACDRWWWGESEFTVGIRDDCCICRNPWASLRLKLFPYHTVSMQSNKIYIQPNHVRIETLRPLTDPLSLKRLRNNLLFRQLFWLRNIKYSNLKQFFFLWAMVNWTSSGLGLLLVKNKQSDDTKNQ